LLAALFLLWQTGGLLHALDHLAEAGRSKAPLLPQHAACLQCLVHAGSEGALAAQPPVLRVPPRSSLPAPALRPGVVSVSFELPYQVRAPPPALA
jgi:hypothetical protein